MNKKLKFSWSHIIAFLALIAVSYITFMGYVYYFTGESAEGNSDFTKGLVAMAITDIVFFIVFITAQQLKAAVVNLSRCIFIERILVFTSPVVFIAGMYGWNHFWQVESRGDRIVETFTTSITASRQIFTDYETYANNRIEAFISSIQEPVNGDNLQPATERGNLARGYQSNSENNLVQTPGVSAARRDWLHRKNLADALRLQLLSENYTELKTDANEWISSANQGASPWNIFLLGNISQIKESITEWHQILCDMSQHTVEGETATPFVSEGAANATQSFVNLHNDFTETGSPTFMSILLGLIVYLALMFPYFIQSRDSKSTYTLIGRRYMEIPEISNSSDNSYARPGGKYIPF